MIKQQKYYLYIVRCADNTLYCGITTDIDRRIRQHNEEKKLGAKYTRARRPVKLVYSEMFTSRTIAMRREWQVKKLTKQEKESLIIAAFFT